MRALALIVGIIIAAVGGVIAYRALFIEPSTAVVITSTDVHELKNWWKAAGGLLMLLVGASTAILAIRRR